MALETLYIQNQVLKQIVACIIIQLNKGQFHTTSTNHGKGKEFRDKIISN